MKYCSQQYRTNKREGVGVSVGVVDEEEEEQEEEGHKKRGGKILYDTIKRRIDRLIVKTDATGDHDYLFCGEDQPQ